MRRRPRGLMPASPSSPIPTTGRRPLQGSAAGVAGGAVTTIVGSRIAGPAQKLPVEVEEKHTNLWAQTNQFLASQPDVLANQIEEARQARGLDQFLGMPGGVGPAC